MITGKSADKEICNVLKNFSRLVFLPGLCLLLVLLAGCASDQAGQPVKITPITLSPGITSTPALVSSTDWTTYHRDNTRAGFVANAPDPNQLTSAWSVKLDGAIYAEPLVVGNRVIVATEGDTLYALNRNNGHVLWHTNVGTPVPQSTLPCGDIDPLGITGTPVYDPATGLVFAVAEIQGPAHILVGVDVNTGQVRVRRLADIPAMDARAHQQRAALALSHNMVYIAYGGLDGDCSDYIGTIVASRTDGTGPLLSYRVPTTREAGIWGASGPAVDAAGNIYVAVGNGAATGGSWDHSDSVLRLSPTLQLEDGFAPEQWAQENAGDADLGSTGPILLPGGLIYADGKSGNGYVLHANALGGVGGQAQVKPVCHSYGGFAASGLQVFVPCENGLMQVTIGSGATITLGWQAPSHIAGSPIVGGNTVYSLDVTGTLYALNIANGSVRASVSVGATPRFNTPTLSGNQIFVGTYNGIVAVNIVG
jgi:outer membrane protein assembly factor BamB